MPGPIAGFKTREVLEICGRGLHSFRSQLNLSSSVHCVTYLNAESVLDLLRLSSNVNECEPLICGGNGAENNGANLVHNHGFRGRGFHSFPFLLNFSLLCPFPLNLRSLCPLYNPN